MRFTRVPSCHVVLSRPQPGLSGHRWRYRLVERRWSNKKILLVTVDGVYEQDPHSFHSLWTVYPPRTLILNKNYKIRRMDLTIRSIFYVRFCEFHCNNYYFLTILGFMVVGFFIIYLIPYHNFSVRR